MSIIHIYNSISFVICFDILETKIGSHQIALIAVSSALPDLCFYYVEENSNKSCRISVNHLKMGIVKASQNASFSDSN